jgi:serine/threonine protein phosphatase PrpC
VHVLSLQDEVLIQESFHIPSRGHFSFFGVFDGHGGRNAAIFTRDHLFDMLKQELRAGVEPSQALTKAYLNVDKKFIAECRGEQQQPPPQPIPTPILTPSLPQPSNHRRQQSANLAVRIPVASLPPANAPGSRSSSAAVTVGAPDVGEKDTSGTTAVSILLHHETYSLYCANVGDSRAVLSGSNNGVVSLTNDHKADRPDEVDRIRRAGGFVVHKRVMGELAISRAIGDLDFKETGFLFVLADPELCTHQLTSSDEFILLACDGIYDVMSNEQACTFIREKLAAGHSIQATAEQLVRHSIETLNTRDNVTVVLVKLPSADELKARGIDAPSAAQTQAHFHDSHVQTPVAANTPHTPAVGQQSHFPASSLSQTAQAATTPARQALSPHHSSTEHSEAHIEFHDEQDGDVVMTPADLDDDSKQAASGGHRRNKSDEKSNSHEKHSLEVAMR